MASETEPPPFVPWKLSPAQAAALEEALSPSTDRPQVLTTLAAAAALPEGSVISWRTEPDDPESERVAILTRGGFGVYGVTVEHTGSDYWRVTLEDLRPLPCTVLRYGR